MGYCRPGYLAFADANILGSARSAPHLKRKPFRLTIVIEGVLKKSRKIGDKRHEGFTSNSNGVYFGNILNGCCPKSL